MAFSKPITNKDIYRATVKSSTKIYEYNNSNSS